jgi:N-sulfoglucosamine sulfohydrolase
MKTPFRLLFCLVFSCTIHAYAQDSRPSIVVIIADDVSYNDFGCYGNKAAKTPNIDALAANGIKFTNAFLTASSCSPSRCSIMSGRYPHNTGAPELHMPLPMHVPTIAGQLKKTGYYVASSGKWHLGDAAKNDFDLEKPVGWKPCRRFPKVNHFLCGLRRLTLTVVGAKTNTAAPQILKM